MKAVKFQDEHKDEMRELQVCHNLIAQVRPNPEEDVKYGTNHAMLIARTIDELSTRVTIEGASFAQQYMLRKGLLKF